MASFMDIKPPKNNNPQPQTASNDNLIMPEPEVTATPTPAPVTPEPAPVPIAPQPVQVAVNADPAPAAPEVPVAPVEAPVAPEPTPEPDPDPLFAPVTEPDPIEPAPATVAPTPAPVVTTQVINKLDDKQNPAVVATGRTVVAASEPHKSRKRTILMLVIGLVLLAGIGFAVYTYFLKPNVAQTETPAAILSVDKLSPEDLTQSTAKGELSAGSQTNVQVITLSGKAPADAPSDLSLEVEIQPLGTDFTGTPTEKTIAVPDESDPLKVALTDYPEGSYHWQARLSDGTNQGPWTAFSTDTDDEEEASKTADFTVDRAAPTAALIKTLNGKAVATKTLSSTVAKPVLAGTAEAGTAITVAFGDAISYKTTATAEGTWTLTAAEDVPNAKYVLTVTSTDPAGNATATTYNLTQAAK